MKDTINFKLLFLFFNKNSNQIAMGPTYRGQNWSVTNLEYKLRRGETLLKHPALIEEKPIAVYFGENVNFALGSLKANIREALLEFMQYRTPKQLDSTLLKVNFCLNTDEEPRNSGELCPLFIFSYNGYELGVIVVKFENIE